MKVDQADESPVRMEAPFGALRDARKMSLAHPLSASSDSFRIVKATISHTLSEFLNFYSLAKATMSGTATHTGELL